MRRRSVKLFRRFAVMGTRDKNIISKHKCIDIIVELWYYIYIDMILVFIVAGAAIKIIYAMFRSIYH